MPNGEGSRWRQLLQQAHAAWRGDHARAALQLCDRAALTGRQGRYHAALLRGNILLRMGDAAGALSSFDSVAEPSVPDAQLDACRGKALLELARFADADNALHSAWRGNPRDAEVAFALGLIAELHHSGQEIEYFRRARRLDPKRFFATPHLGHDDFEAAVADALRSLPAPLQEDMRRVTIMVAEVPDPDELRRREVQVSPLAFGMWITETNAGPRPLKPVEGERGLVLFKRNLERASADRPQLKGHIVAFVRDGLSTRSEPWTVAEVADLDEGNVTDANDGRSRSQNIDVEPEAP